MSVVQRGNPQPDPSPTPARPPVLVSAAPAAAVPAAPAAPDEVRYLHRDLSWLEFNRRVLAQAADPRLPLLERVKFLAIFTSNLDEFFMKRMWLLKRMAQGEKGGVVSVDGLTPREALSAARALVTDLQDEQVRLYQQDILPALVAQDIHIVRYADLSSRDRRWVDEWYRANVFPALTPLAVDPGHRFPFISNLSDNIGILATPPATPRAHAPLHPEEPELQFARVKIPPGLKRFVAISPKHTPRGTRRVDRFVELSDLIRNHLHELFPGVQVHESVIFRVTRSAGIQRDDALEALDAAGTGTLIQSVEEDLRQRRFARAVRLEVEPHASQQFRQWLLDKLSLDSQDLYEHPACEFDSMFELGDIDRPDLKHAPWRGVVPPVFRRVARGPRARLEGAAASAANLMALIRKRDILVHHPYESFHASVERFISAAAADPDVVAIKQTLYRTSPDSPFIASLIRAADSGKQVACLVELRARFDEDRNVRFARQLEKAGVHVAYGVLGLKTHCKAAMVVRRERSGLRCYAHLGTGNYHPKTAQLYTDIGLFTCDPDITSDLVSVFNYLTGLGAPRSFDTLLVAPFTMRQRFNALIDREAENARRGLPARIIAKINSMEDRETAERLYAASAAGVPITLIVRGFCCLRPGVPGLSDNIRVVSVVGRFLEHSRIFHFAGGQADPLDGEWYFASADWMYRNLSNRVELATPVRDEHARRRLWRILEVSLQDRRCAWDMRTDGTYVQRHPGPDAEPDSPAAAGTFETLMWEAGRTP